MDVVKKKLKKVVKKEVIERRKTIRGQELKEEYESW